MSGTITFSENFEGGTGGTITTADTGFTAVQGAGLTAFSSLYTQGTQSGQFTSYAFGSIYYCYGEHSFATSQNLVYLRWTVWSAGGTYSSAIAGVGVSSGTSPNVSLLVGGYVALSNNGSVVATTVNTVPNSQWTLMEWSVDAINNMQYLRLYSGFTGLPIETISGTYNQGSMISGQIGAISPSAAVTVFIDAYAEAFDDWIGPYGASVAATTAWLVA